MQEDANKNKSGMDIPDYAIESIARVLLPKIQRFYESEEGKRTFVEWKARKEQGKADRI